MKTVIVLKPGYGVVRGAITAKLFTAAQRLPGFHKWKEGVLVFEHSKANLEIILDAVPDAQVIDEAGRIEDLKEAHGQRTARSAMIKATVRHRLAPFDHQKRAVAWAAERTFGMLRMGIGTGKSYTVLMHAAQMFAEDAIDRALVITRPVVKDDFLTDYIPNQFPAGVPVEAWSVETGKTKWQQWDRRKLQLGFVTPQLFARPNGAKLIDDFVRLGRCAIYVDESHDFSNPTAKRTAALEKVGERATFKFMMTGTLTPRGLENLFAQYRFLHPDIIGHGSFSSFKNEFCIIGGFENHEIIGYRNQEKLMAAVAPHTFYVDIRDCFDMPEQTWRSERYALRKEHVEMLDDLKTKFVTTATEAKRELDQRIQDFRAGGLERSAAIKAARKAMEFTRVVSSLQAQHVAMRGIAHGYFRPNPLLDDAGSPLENQPPPVFLHNDRVAPIIERMLDDRRPILVWCAYRDDVDHVVRAFGEAGHDVGVIVGGMSTRAKQAVIEAGRANAVRAIIGTEGAGGVGVNLQFAAHSVFFSNTYSWGDREQTEGRTWRAGQGLPCVYTDMTCTSPIASTLDAGYRDNMRKKRNIDLTFRGFLKMASAFEAGAETFLFDTEEEMP